MARSGGIVLALCLCSVARAVTIAASDARVTWTGRRVVSGGGAVTFDWEGTQARLAVTGATYVTATIADTAHGGARFAVYYNSTGASGSGSPNLRVGTLLTAPQVTSYVLAAGEWLAAAPSTLTLRLLTEPHYVADGPGAKGNLTVVAFSTDGAFAAAPPPAPSARRLIFLGDSLTAGYGSGFDAPAADPASCGGGTAQNDGE